MNHLNSLPISRTTEHEVYTVEKYHFESCGIGRNAKLVKVVDDPEHVVYVGTI